MKQPSIREYLKQHPLITDGAFGTYYAAKYPQHEIPDHGSAPEMPEQANLLHGERVKEIHREYLAAGASLLRTNTYASNTVLLMDSPEQIAENLREAVRLAREAIIEYRTAVGTDRPIYLAGDIGPVPSASAAETDAVREEYTRNVRTFLECGVEILHFETMPDLEAILPAIRMAVSECERQHIPAPYISVSFSVNPFGYSAAGLSARHLLQEAAQEPGVDAVGLNCGMGAGHMFQILERMCSRAQALPGDVSLLALPNAGYPTLSRDHLRYDGTAAYFAEKMQDFRELGVNILGGCCGTDPEFIRLLAKRTDDQLHHIEVSDAAPEEERPRRNHCGFLYDEKGNRKTGKLIAVELAPPFDVNDEKLLESAHILRNAKVDVLTFPDSPSGRTRVDSVLMAEKVHRATGMDVMPHLCCRDKNALAMRSLLMGAQINDILNMLIVTGDPLPSAARETVKAVFNFDSVGLMRMAQEMNGELFGDRTLCYGGAINHGRPNLDVEIGRVKKKMSAGAEFFLTQPVFTREDAERLRRVKAETGACILCGVMPLVNRRNALFMRNEIAGVQVTDEIIARYPENASRDEGEAVGVALARDVIAMVQDFADGYYFTFPFNRAYLMDRVLQ